MEDNLNIEVVTDVEVDIENEIDIDIEVEQAGPAGKDGKSAYEIYVDNGGNLTETEWLESLKGPPGNDGYTPIVGEDYWTVADKNEIKSYCDAYIAEQLGVIENGSY